MNDKNSFNEENNENKGSHEEVHIEEMMDDDEEKGSGIGRKIIITIIVIALLVIGAYYLTGTTEDTNNVKEVDQEEMTDDKEEGDSNTIIDPVPSNSSITVNNQIAGSSVTISSITLDRSAWVSVEEDNDGERGNILGALWLPAGTHSSQSIELLRSTESGSLYHIVLRGDDGDKRFDYIVDTELQSDGENITATFSAL